MKQITLALFLFLGASIGFSQSISTGIKQYQSEQYESAARVFKGIDDDHGDYAEAQYYLGRIAFEKENYDDAQDYFEEAIDHNDNNANYHYWYGNSVGIVARDANVIKQGFLAPKIKSAYEKAVELDPKMIDAHWGLVEYYTQAPGFMGGSWEKATQTAKQISTLDKERGHQAMATVFLRQEKYDDAEREYKELLKIDKKYVLNLGYFYQGQKQFDKAFELFSQEYDKDNTNHAALYQIGRTSAMSGKRTELGIKSLKQYLNIADKKATPSHAAANMRLGMIYEKSGKKELAKQYYKKSLAEDANMKLAKEGLKRL